MSDIERRLATIRKIVSIDAIDGADNIVCATVDGWKLVTQKSNNFKPGDLVIYFEIDSYLPCIPMFEFLRKSSYRKMSENEEGFRLKTIKLRGQVSQGLILPVSEFLPGLDVVEGLDVTQTFGVKKWDPPLPAALRGQVKGNFPSFLKKTDQERIQNMFGSLFEKYEATLKLDGSSMTVYSRSVYGEDRPGVGKRVETGVCSRNMELEETEGNAYWTVARKSKLLDILPTIGSYAVQGELMGPGVQGNRENLKELQMYVFDIYDIDRARYLTPYERRMIFNLLREKGCTIEHVPVVAEEVRLNQFNSVDDFLAYADRSSINHPIAEGVVFKSFRSNGNTFKAISNKFLLKEKD